MRVRVAGRGHKENFARGVFYVNKQLMGRGRVGYGVKKRR